MRLVDADKIKNCLEWDKLDGYQERDDMEDWELIDVKYSQGFNAGIDRAIYYLENKDMQAEVEHGHWIYRGILEICSVCKQSYNRQKYGFNHKYCPNCGARMDGDDK